jgi:hypothetical protein
MIQLCGATANEIPGYIASERPFGKIGKILWEEMENGRCCDEELCKSEIEEKFNGSSIGVKLFACTNRFCNFTINQ